MNVVQHQIQRIVHKFALDATRDRKDILAMQVLAPLSSRYLPWAQAAMRPSAIAALLNEIVINRRRRVVECGGGVSTFYIGRLLSRQGGHLYTIEHDEDWARLLAAELTAEGLAGVVTVICAPLAPTSVGWPGRSTPWYAEDQLTCLQRAGGIDLLIVDGPPAYSADLRYARYPAVPFFKDALAADYAVVLDDINRRGEQEILERWESMLGVKFQRRFVDGSIGLGRARASFGV
ncbi:MAG TPA: class I SAM-dependent methyltransferase [Chloroflexia bacterium]|nr:class I SAM-dependent methyltransferase [Chloroflexia bacterium]